MRAFCLFCTLLLLLFLPFSTQAEGIDLYISPLGEDTAAGTAAAPLRTLHEAIRRVEQEKPSVPVTLWLGEGIHRLEETLTLSHRIRGGITFRACPGETPVITGDIPLTGWTDDTLHGGPVWAMRYEAKELRAVYTETGALQNARWPKAGTVAATPTKVIASKFTNQRSFLGGENLPDSLEGAYVRLLHWWKDELSGVRSFDKATGRITMRRSTAMTIAQGDPFWLENVLSVPLSPGEWGYDQEAAMLYYAPQPGETKENTNLYAGNVELLIAAEGVSNLTFEGITFARTGWSIPLRDSSTDFPQAAVDASAALYLLKGKNITISGCTFRDIGAGCIRLDPSMQDVAIRDCVFENIGAQAIFLRGRNTGEEAGAIHGLTIENNHINGYGRNFLNAPAILVIHASDMDIRHNEIHDGYYTAISAGWVWGTGYNVTDHLRICDNLIYDIGQGMLSDMGGIYALGVQRNTVITGNIIYEVNAAEYGGWGIYLDEGANGILVENNLAHHCSSQGFHQHNGVRNTVRNNIFAYNLMGQVGTSDKQAGGTFVLEGNLLIGQEPFFWRKYEKEKIDIGENLYYTDGSPFVDLSGGSFWLVDDPAYLKAGFVPWENSAGRR